MTKMTSMGKTTSRGSTLSTRYNHAKGPCRFGARRHERPENERRIYGLNTRSERAEQFAAWPGLVVSVASRTPLQTMHHDARGPRQNMHVRRRKRRFHAENIGRRLVSQTSGPSNRWTSLCHFQSRGSSPGTAYASAYCLLCGPIFGNLHISHLLAGPLPVALRRLPAFT